MVDPAEFRAGSFSIPYSSQDELPPCCFACVYLLSEESMVCYCASFYYFCAYSWPDKLTHTVPPCLQES
ncbi:MAG: hypothetical protein A2Z73_06940 [Deltaproteobacteria bacterium RBG_13_60_28]|jgi:hypothetical protein|nr:MAG: hypothetical protein A2Z73_06940 [Deltaproteobacteria bacterium RBG_13_60_28]